MKDKKEQWVGKNRKARGAFFTPPEIARFISDWAIHGPQDRILEPSCGEAAFMLSAVDRLRAVGTLELSMAGQLHGQDIHPASVEEARALLAEQGVAARLEVGDFFQREPKPEYDAVIGNPPYVRYQNFAGEQRTRALAAALRQGVRLNQLASSWAAFTVHAAAFLKPEGRLGLVLPAELLAVNYAAQIRRFLLKRFSSVRLVLFENRVFPGVLEEVVLLLAEGYGGARSFEVYQARDAGDLARLAPENWANFTPKGEEKWTSALLPTAAMELYEQLVQAEGIEVIGDWGETYLGAVTGNNKYFTLTKAEAGKLGLPRNEVLRISPPGSRHLRGVVFSEHAWEQQAEKGERCYLFYPGDTPSRQAQRYIKAGEKQKVHEAYKCQVRSPWWRVPLVQRPDLLFTYMNQDRPKMVRNGASVHLLNSVYGITLRKERRALGQALLPLATLNSLSLLGGEIVGRAYGGGMLKHEPNEVDRLAVPSFRLIEQIGSRLQLLQSQVAAQLRRNDITPALDIVDRMVLRDGLGLTERQIMALREAREVLLKRRLARSKGKHGKD